MGVKRAATAALAAFLAGSVAQATLVRAQERAAAPASAVTQEDAGKQERAVTQEGAVAHGAAVDASHTVRAAIETPTKAETGTASEAGPAWRDVGAQGQTAGSPPAIPPAVSRPATNATAGSEGKPAATAEDFPSREAERAAAPPVAESPAPAAAPAEPAVAQVPPPPPADPLAVALAARLGETAPLLPRFSNRDREALQAFYALGAFKPVWIADGVFTPAAKAVAARLALAAEDGLDPAAYPVPVLGVLSRPDSPAELAEADAKLSAAVALYARDARGGRINPANLSRLITPSLDLPTPDAVVGPLATAGARAGDLLQRYNPQEAGYRALKARLAAERDRKPAGRTSEADAQLLVNMERWRWLPTTLGPDYVMVNVPEFRLRVFRHGRLRDETRVIVGKTESPTPLFSGLMEYAVVNPSWNVPPSILKNEFLPGLARDPNYAASRGYEVVRRGNSIAVRQPPGERNALGFIKFMFPNNHAVYLHDTPNRSLFGRSERALSHGCVRVDDPFRFADSVLPDAWPSERLKSLIGKGERTVRLSEKLPVHLAYFTAFVDDTGSFRTLPDLYGYDGRLRAALGLPGGTPAVARAPEAKRKAAEMPRPKPVQRAARPQRHPEVALDPYGGAVGWVPAPAPVTRSWW